MDTAYFRRRLEAETRMVGMATDPCARAAHRALATAYRSRLAVIRRGRQERASNRARCDVNWGMGQWLDDGGAWRETGDATPLH